MVKLVLQGQPAAQAEYLHSGAIQTDVETLPMPIKRRQVPVGWASFISPTFYAERWADKASPTYVP